MKSADSRPSESKPKTPREIALDTMCSTLRAAYREWERKEGSKGQ